MSGYARQHQVTVTTIPELGRSIRAGSDLVALWKLWRLFRRERPALVHTHTAKAGTLGRVAALLAGVPVRIHTYHGHVFRGYFSPLMTRLAITIEAALARFTTAIIVISPRQADEIAGFLRLRREVLHVVPLGLDLERFRSVDVLAARARFRDAIVVTPSQVVISVVGRLVAIKNHRLALRALRRMLDAGQTPVLAIVGGGELEQALRDEARTLGVESQVRFAGWWDDLVAVYHGSDVIALTSDNEGTPVCLIEALACGRPVISTAVGGVSDVLDGGKRGALVPAGDADALASALGALMDPAARVRWTGASADEVIALYGIERLADDVERLYDQLLARS